MATSNEIKQSSSSVIGHKPSFGKSISQSISSILGRKDGFFFELEFLTDSPSHTRGEKKQILTDYVELGRSYSCYIRFKGGDIEDLVSGHHVSITSNGGTWTLTHLSKTNSTIIDDGSRIIRPNDSLKTFVLEHGDTIQLAKGGPKLRFVVPENNSANSIREKSHGTTFIRNLALQLIKPYIKKFTVIIAILVAIVIGLAAYAIKKNIDQQQKVIEQETIMADLRHTIDSINRLPHNIDPIVVPSEQPTPSMTEMIDQQNIVPCVYYISAQAVVTNPDGSEDTIGKWTGTGFLLDDGRFVTARHCVEAWLYDFSDDSPMVRNSVLVESYPEAYQLKTLIKGINNRGDVLRFTSTDFTMNRNLDKLIKIDQGEDGRDIIRRIPLPLIANFDPKMYSTDWACARANKRGSLKPDANMSQSLTRGQKLLVLGYPMGLGAHTTPLSYIMDVSHPGLDEHDCIVHGNGTDHGNSGGPIFAERDGKLVVVGIVSCGIGSVYNLAVPISNIRNR